MKAWRVLAIIFMLVSILLLFYGCTVTVLFGSATSELEALKATYNSTVNEEAPSEPGTPVIEEFNGEEVAANLEVTAEAYDGIYSDYVFLVVKNTSAYTLQLNADVKFYDAEGNLVGASQTSTEAVESGFDTLMWVMQDNEFATFEYEIQVSEDTFYEPVLSDLSCEETVAGQKVILEVTNNGTEAAMFVQGYVIFYKGGEIVGRDWTYFTDDDSEIKPGKTITREFECYEDFDEYKVYFSGRRHK